MSMELVFLGKAETVGSLSPGATTPGSLLCIPDNCHWNLTMATQSMEKFLLMEWREVTESAECSRHFLEGIFLPGLKI